MARIRTVKPEIWTSGQFVECSTNARLLFIGLFNFCDDGGRHPASLRRLKMEVYPADPFDDDAIRGWVEELKAAVDENGVGLITEYTANGCAYWEVTGWQRHQRVDRPCFRYPDRSGFVPNSTNARRTLDDDSSNIRRGASPGVESSRVESESNRKGTNIDRSIEATDRPTAALDSTNARRTLDESACVPAESIDWAAFDWRPVPGLCNETVDRLRMCPTTERDRRLVVEVVALVAAKAIPQTWLDRAVEGCGLNRGKTQKPWAYFQTALIRNAQDEGVDLRRLLKDVPVPESLMKRREPKE